MIELDFDNHLLDTLPEGLVLPLREAVTTCQADPSTTWDEKALRLVGRDDVRLLLAPSQERRDLAASQLVCLCLQFCLMFPLLIITGAYARGHTGCTYYLQRCV